MLQGNISLCCRHTLYTVLNEAENGNETLSSVHFINLLQKKFKIFKYLLTLDVLLL